MHLMRWKSILTVWALMLVAEGSSLASTPNIVIVLADDMGYGDAGCYNPDSQCPTPHIDALAKQGMRFTDAHSAGAWCTPSRYGLLTGRYPFRTSLQWRNQPVIADGIQTIADVLRDANYATAMVGKWHLGFENAENLDFNNVRGGPVDRGFDSFFGLPASLDIPDYYWIINSKVPHPPTVPIADSNTDGWSSIQGKFWRGGLRGKDFIMHEVLDRIADEAETSIEKLSHSSRPFFLYVPLTSPHTPWLPSARHRDASKAGLYGQFVAHTDAVLGRIVQQVHERGIEDTTLVIFTSDNGPVWYTTDTQRFGHDAAGGLRGMKGDVWEAGHRVPFIVKWPGHVPAGTTQPQLFSFVDLHATLATLAGATKSTTALDSISFADVWLGKTENTARTQLISFQDAIVLRDGPWKLITRPGSSGFLSDDPRQPFLSKDALNPELESPNQAAGQLYHLERDPGEARNLWNERPAVVRRLKATLQELMQVPARK